MNSIQQAFEIQVKAFSELDNKVSSAFDEIIDKYENGITGPDILKLHEQIIYAVFEAEKSIQDFLSNELSRETLVEIFKGIKTGNGKKY